MEGQPEPADRPADPASFPDIPVPTPAAEPGGAGRKIPALVWVVGAAGVLFALLVLAGIGAAVAIPSMLKANQAERQAAVQELLRSLASSERMYASQSGGGAYGTLGEMVARGFIDSSLAVEPVRAHGYLIRTVWIAPRSFCFSATPDSKRDTPYFIDQTMTVYEGYPTAGSTPGKAAGREP